MTSSLVGKVRIIAGQWRRRQITFPVSPGCRPTHDRVRETLFNWLSPYIAGANCLDLFAGSGALGFEALSRGAKHVTFVDHSKVVVDALIKNAALLKTDNAEIILDDCLQQIPMLSHAPFDIVFLDPPFGQGLVEQSIAVLEESNVLREKAFVYVEIESDSLRPPVPAHWELFREKKTRSLVYYLFQASCKGDD